MTNRLIILEQDSQIRVAWQPEGQLVPAVSDPIPFAPALGSTDREDLRWYLEDYLRAPYAVYETRGQEIRARLDALGHALFESLFGVGRPGRDAYVKATSAGVRRCEVVVQSDRPDVLGQPWEILKDPGHPEPLALEFAGQWRTLPVRDTALDVPATDRLRVLLVIARPSGDDDVGHQMVARPLMKRLPAVAGRVEITVLRPPTFNHLQETLKAARKDGEPFHIVHFDGHGNFGVKTIQSGGKVFYDAGGPKGYLFFETAEGGNEPVAADVFAAALTQNQVPVVVLNACRSAQQDEAAGPEATVATRLLQHGVAAVVAMSHSVYAVAAAEFVAVFYQTLFEGQTLAQAVAAGRRQLRRRNERPSPKGPLPLADWMVPVLYAHREVKFPGLMARKQRGRPKLSDVLDGLRDAAARPTPQEGTQEGTHDPSSIESTGPFYGRDRAFLRLERWMLRQPVVVVHGQGGSGKTELAKAFARWWRDTGGTSDPGLVFFHSFEPGIASFGLDGVVTSVGLALFGADFGRLPPDQRAPALLRVMAEHRLLLVWDNFESVYSIPDPAGITQPLNDTERQRIAAFLAAVLTARHSGVIITSRSPESWLGDDVARLEIGGLDGEDAA
ncbi:MAG: CHAT domain-containing protein, partial [Alphaproteobacteria bacterium]